MNDPYWEQLTQDQSTQCGSLMTLDCPFSLQEEEEEEEEEEVVPTEEIITIPRARRSSYAFSHQEGYANLITQGTILRRSPGVHRHMHPMLSDEEHSTSIDAI